MGDVMPPNSAAAGDALSAGAATQEWINGSWSGHPYDLGQVVTAHGATLGLASGSTLVDFSGGGVVFGDPRITQPVSEQLRQMPLSNRSFLSRPLAALVQRLAELSPGELTVSYVCNSEREALDGAIKLARGLHRRRPVVVAVVPNAPPAVMPSGWRNTAPDRTARLPIECVFVESGDVIALDRAMTRHVCALVLEPISTSAGVHLPPPEYLATAQRVCRRTGALLIADEISTGLGRTGTLFGISRETVNPDVLVLGNALGGGVLPMGAYITTRAVNNRVYGRRTPVLHGSTTGGNPTACVAALAVLDVIEHDGVPAHCRQLARSIDSVLREMSRGWSATFGTPVTVGLLASIPVRSGRVATLLQAVARKNGLLLGLQGSVAGPAWLTIRPPLLISQPELDRGLGALVETVHTVVGPPDRRGASS